MTLINSNPIQSDPVLLARLQAAADAFGAMPPEQQRAILEADALEKERDELENELAEAERLAREAMAAIRASDTALALDILAKIAPDRVAEKERKKEEELAALFTLWKAEPAPRPDFLTFAHKRRKWSAV